RDVLHHFFSVFDEFVLERVATIGSAEDGPATRQDAAHVLGFEHTRAFGKDQPIKAVLDADDLPAVLDDRALHRRADHRVQSWAVDSTSGDADRLDSSHAPAPGRKGCGILAKERDDWRFPVFGHLPDSTPYPLRTPVSLDSITYECRLAKYRGQRSYG